MSIKTSSFPTATTPYIGTETVGGLQAGGNVQLTLPGIQQFLAQFLVPDTFTGAGGTAFTLTRTPFYPAGAMVTVNGVELIYTIDYSISGTTLTLVNAAASTDVVKARYL